MRKHGYLLTYLITVLIQILLSEYLNLTQYVLISILPVLVLCLPLGNGTFASMAIAFVTGLAVDFLTGGVLGITSFALVPVAAFRRIIISWIFGAEVFSIRDKLTVRRFGLDKFIIAILIVTAVYFLFFIPVDSAGTWTFGGNALRFLLSVFFSSIVAILIINSVAAE